MTARDPDRLIRAFLTEGEDELPERAYDTVRAHIEHIRQRVVFGPWKEPRITSFSRIALAAAALVAAAVVGLNLQGGQFLIGGPGPTPSPSPTPSPMPLPGSGDLASGTFVISDPSYTVAPMTFVVPYGWATSEGFVHKHSKPPVGEEISLPLSAVAVLSTWIPTHVYGDACQWEGTLVDVGRSTTFDELATVLAGQESRVVSGPEDTTVGGYPAKRLELSLPADFDVSTCDKGFARNWPDPGPDESGGWPILEPQTDVIYVVSVGGEPMLVVLTSRADASTTDVAELEGIAQSIRFDQ